MRQTETITRNIQININICRNHSSGSLPVSSQRSATLGVGKSGMGLSSWLRPWNVGKPLTLWIFHIPLIHWVLCRFLLLKHPSLKKKHLKDSKIVSVASDILPMLLGVPRLEGYLDDVFCDAFTPPLLTKTPPYHRGLENDGCSRLLFHFSLVLNLQGEW